MVVGGVLREVLLPSVRRELGHVGLGPDPHEYVVSAR